MAYRFKASPAANQHHETVRQFQNLEQALVDMERRIREDLILGFIVPNFTFAAHGTMFNTLPVTGPDIPGTGVWQTVTAFDTVSAAQRITFDTGADTWTYNNSGVYQVSVEIIVSHTEAQAGRTTFVRLNNGVDPAGSGVPISIARNQPGSNIAISFLQDVPVDQLNRTWTVEVGNGDALAGVVWEATSVTIVNVGAWIDDLGNEVSPA